MEGIEDRILGRDADPAGRTIASAMDVTLSDRERRFHAFVEFHRDRAVRLAWRLIGCDDAAAAEDVTQDAFLKAYRALPRFREESSLDTWFYRILVRQVQSHRRWKAVRDAWTTVWEGEIPDTSLEIDRDRGLQRRIARALDRLTRKQREAFILVHLEEFTVRESAELLGMAVGTVKSHLQRALKTLRSELADLQTPLEDCKDDFFQRSTTAP